MRTLHMALLSAFIFMSALASAGAAPNAAERALETFLQRYAAAVHPLMIANNLASWTAQASGKPADYEVYQKYETQYKQYHANRSDFSQLKTWKQSGEIRDPLLARQLDVVYSRYARNQIPADEIARLVALSTKIEKTFNTHRGTYQGKPVSDNDLKAVLAREKDSTKRRAAWEAQKTVGEEVAPLIIQLVKMRNKAARDMGFKDFYTMSLELDELKVEEVFRIFDELAVQTDAPFRTLKSTIDTQLASMWGIRPDEMQAWHYQDFFFQAAPDLGAVDLDAIFSKRDVVKLVSAFFSSINLNPEGVLAKSDLYERPGKYQHAQCGDLDRSGDVRVMANMRNNEYWNETLLHELGHGVYSWYCDRTLPFDLRDAAHTLTTEGVADMFGRLTYNPEWLVKVAGASPDEIEKVKGQLAFNDRMGQLVFCRWSQVMSHFERALYENPDQDLNDLWWRMVEKYQFVKRPAGRKTADWASKIHFVSSPAYYHNYLLGRLFSSQLLHTLANLPPHRGSGRDLSFVGRPDVGAFLIAKVFYPGTRYRWDEMIRRATGEGLTPRYYVEDFVRD